MVENPSITLPGTVEKIIRSVIPNESDKAQIVVEGADHLYRELRIENTLTDKHGNIAHLESGANVQVTFKSESEESASKSEG